MSRPTVLYSEEQIARRVAELGRQITEAKLDDSPLCVVGLMKSTLVFMSDLIRKLDLDVECHFMRVSSIPDDNDGTPRTDIAYSTEIPIEGRHILLLEDIVDTGITISFLMDHIRDRQPASLRVCTLLDKPSARKIDIHPDWVGFALEPAPDGFVVGYGLDFEERWRGLPYLGLIPRTSPDAAAVPAGTGP